MTDLRYPVGKHEIKGEFTDKLREELVQEIAEAPANLRSAVKGLSEQQLDTPYRPDGWTVRQVVHHLCDSHMNAYIRFKLAMTEDRPTTKPYQQQLWAETYDSRTAPIQDSLALLESLHSRWVLVLRSLKHSDFSRTLIHPENGVMKLEDVLRLYAWHGRHHVGHIISLRERMSWK